jgi:HAD superfamily, subfamily IIIB (Acid phosphatase)
MAQLRSLRSLRPLRTAAVTTAAVAVTALAVGGSGVALTSGHHHTTAPAVPAPPAAPTRANQIQNIDQVKTAIKAYYGDTVTSTPDPVDGATVLHTFDPHGAYAKEVRGDARKAERYLDGVRAWFRKHHKPGVKKAILLDVDDTSLNTYNYEIYSNFVYNPTTNAAFVNSGVFPAVPGMVKLSKIAKDEGYQVFWLTGRPESQRAGTLSNLINVGYTPQDDHVFLKDYVTDTWLSSCAPSCTTIQYKSLTRQHIQSLGYRILANFGDQYSDLKGGYAKRTFKLPNPMYYLP